MKKRTIIIVIGLILVAALGAFGIQRAIQGRRAEMVATAPVQEGPFQSTLKGTGTVKALRTRIISSEIWGATIIKMIPEGTVVKADDPVVWFDRTELERRLRERQIRMEREQSQLVSQKEDVAFQQYQKEMAIKRMAASLDHALAGLAEGEAQLTRQQELFDNKLLSRSDMEDAELALREAEIGLQKAVTDSVKAAEDHSSGIKIQEAEIRRKEADVERAQRELEEVEQDLEKTIIRAPFPGMILYFKDWRGQKLKVGTEVHKGHKLLEVPDMSELTVELSVRERDISWVRTGQKATVRVDAFPDIALYGVVHKIATLAADGGAKDFFGKTSGGEGTSVFTVTILIDKDDLAEKQALIVQQAQSPPRASPDTSVSAEGATNQVADGVVASDTTAEAARPTQIIPGMAATADILVDALPRALYVPLESVIERDSTRVLYVMEGSHWEERQAVFGIWNENDIVVRQGIEKGERVCLRDPTVELTLPDEEERASQQQ